MRTLQRNKVAIRTAWNRCIGEVATLAGAAMVATLMIGATAATQQATVQGKPDARRMYSGEMLPDEAVRAFAENDRMFAVRVVRHGAKVRELPAASSRLHNVRFTSVGKNYDLYDYLALNRVVGLLVLKNGHVVAEDYELGIGPQNR